MTDGPSFDEFKRLLKGATHANVTIKTDTVAVTVSPKYQLLDVSVCVKGLDDDKRTALQGDIVKAVNKLCKLPSLLQHAPSTHSRCRRRSTR